MKYDKFAYLYPPRPEKAVPSNFLGFYRKQGWIAQVKKNGTCNVLFVSPERQITAMSRHNDDHKAWTPTEKSSAAFAKLPGKGWYVFTTEVLNNKVPGIRDTHYIFDILVADGVYLIDTTFESRQEILRDLFLTGDEEETFSHYIINDNVWLAKIITEKFKTLFTGLTNPEDEGLVLKDPKAKLKLCSKPKDNSGWQVKCRAGHKNFGF